MPASTPCAPGTGPGGVDRVLVGDADHLVQQLTVEHRRHETRADALDAMRAGLTPGQNCRPARLDRDDPQIGVAFAQVSARTR